MEIEQGHRMTATSYRLYPNATSERRMLATLEHCRSLYNRLLADCKADAVEGLPRRSMFDMYAEVKRVADGDPGMKRAVYSTCLRDVGRRVFNAMRGCGWNSDGNLEHLPRFKSGHRYRSFTYRTVQGFEFKGDAIVLSKIGRMRCRGRRPPRGAEPRMCTVKLDARGHWHATVVYRIPDIKRGWTGLDGPAFAIGYDLGLRDVVTSSEGEHVVCPEFLRGPRDEVKKLQRTMSEEEKGSSRWERARRRLAVIHLDIRNRRKGFFDRLAHDMTDGRMVIVMEDLSPKRMKEMDGTSAAVRDKYTEANWGYLMRKIGFKAEEAGSRMILVDPQYTSRTCCRCGHVVQSLSLSQRTFACETCGNVMDRDWNAAINILNRGLGVEAVRKENGRRGRQHGCWPVCHRSATHLGLTSPITRTMFVPSNAFINSTCYVWPMTETVEGKKSPMAGFIDDFKSLTPKQWLGIVAAIALALILEIYMGTNCMGFLVVAVVLYMIPHLLKVMSVKVKTVVGVIFIVAALLLGTFAFSGTLASNENLINTDSNQIKDVTYDEATDTIEFYVNPELEGEDWDVLVQYVPVVGISFGMANRAGSEAVNTYLEPSSMTLGSDGWYHGTITGLGLQDGQYYQIGIGIMENAQTESESTAASLVFWYDYDADTTMICLTGTAYTVAFAAILFFMILVFSAMMRSSAEKTRAKMEAEGRLYPQGYGRCKQCGAMVLPGEVNCRKCGAYIDVPDELRVKKKDFFQCSECGAEVPSDATECPKCGAKFDEAQENVVVHADGTEDISTESIVCPECGSTVPSNADWCPKCGKMLKDKKQ